MPSNGEFAHAQAKFPAYLWNTLISYFHKRRFFAYSKQSRWAQPFSFFNQKSTKDTPNETIPLLKSSLTINTYYFYCFCYYFKSRKMLIFLKIALVWSDSGKSLNLKFNKLILIFVFTVRRRLSWQRKIKAGHWLERPRPTIYDSRHNL